MQVTHLAKEVTYLAVAVERLPSETIQGTQGLESLPSTWATSSMPLCCLCIVLENAGVSKAEGHYALKHRTLRPEAQDTRP